MLSLLINAHFKNVQNNKKNIATLLSLFVHIRVHTMRRSLLSYSIIKLAAKATNCK